MDLSRAVLALHSRGVTIRVLSDKDYTAITGSQIGVLRRAGKGNRSVYFQIIVKCVASRLRGCNSDCGEVFLCQRHLQIQAQGDMFSP